MFNSSKANALMLEKLAGKNAVSQPTPKSTRSIKGLRPNKGMKDEKKLNRMKG